MSSQARRRVPAAMTGVMLGCVLALGAAWWTRLPEPSATHWGPSGVADGHGPRWLLVLLPVVAVGGMTIVGAFGGWRGVRAVWSTGLGPLLAATTGGVTVLALRANLDAADWRDAREIHLPVVLAMIAAGFVVGGVVQRLALSIDRGDTTVAGTTSQPTSIVERDPADPRVVKATVRVIWAALLGVSLALAGALVAARGGVGMGATLFLAGLVTATFSSASVQADTSGLRVRLGPLGLPRVFVPIEEMVAAQSLRHLEPLEWGGWGYRGSLSMFGSAAVVLRRGEALVLQLSRNRRFAVTTSDSEQAAKLLNDLIRRR